jgi:hypothetical protein
MFVFVSRETAGLRKSAESSVAVVQVSAGVSSGFWVMADMLSGRYLYHNLKGQAQAEGEKVN